MFVFCSEIDQRVLLVCLTEPIPKWNNRVIMHCSYVYSFHCQSCWGADGNLWLEATRRATSSPIFFLLEVWKVISHGGKNACLSPGEVHRSLLPARPLRLVSGTIAFCKTFCFLSETCIQRHTCAHWLLTSLDLLSTHLWVRCCWFPYCQKMFWNCFSYQGVIYIM